ncbi:TonB-dependent receptor [Hephaestia mangrovi]|uniref:TonB-dependent receptor n=1 Tax=Hephaestia mangrovi TaxID=2873268 RepID=UPI001CA65270|nr:TonB-dependent receptor [Hephaestia mangrovi]MBY8829870.1 TonB-dependent receptor [Hephaestia mangrovi]
MDSRLRRQLAIGRLAATLLAGSAWPALAHAQAQHSVEATAAQQAGPNNGAAQASSEQNGPSAARVSISDDQGASISQDNPAAGEIVVTGYRASLESSVRAKKQSIGFSDSIFAEDIGKFPDTNIAESFNRIPGITINRDITGEGVNVAIRGLGSNFTNVTLNGAPISIASSGATDAQGTDRSVDLSFFPTELFTKLTVYKSYKADLLEGGAAGNIDMRSARPFDHPGTRLTYSLQGAKEARVGKLGTRGSLIFSTTPSDTFGILVGVAGQRLFTDTRGYETIGFTNPNLTAAQCGASSGCNTTGGGNFTIPSTVPAGAGAGLTAGETIDKAWLLAHNPGATIEQIDNGILPRIGRPSAEFGSRSRINSIVSLEFRPSDALHFYVDGMYGYKHNNLQREDMMWIVRNSSIIPINTTYDRADCSNGCVVTGGTFANTQFFLEYRPYIETTKEYGVNPGMDWQIAKNLKLQVNANYTRSTFHRENPAVDPVTPLGQNVTATFNNNDGGIPTIQSSVDLNDPSNFVWDGGRISISDERRLNWTKGLRGDLTWGDDHLNLKVGANYDDLYRRIRGYDNSRAWQNYICGGNPSVNLPGPNTQPPCRGDVHIVPGQNGYPDYPGYGTGYTAGQTGTISYGGSVVPVGSIPDFLRPGPAGFVTVDFDKFKSATNYDEFHANETDSGGSTTGASGGVIEEKTPAAYAEVNGNLPIGDNSLRFGAGLRFVHTDQTIGGRVSISDPRNTRDDGTSLPDGALYPNVTTFVYTHNKYDAWLPAINLAYNIGQHAVVRAAYSKTMTRPDPSAQLPGVNFSDISAAQASIGNSALKPYFSDNIDLGFEYYTGNGGLISFDAFRKSIKGFTQNNVVTQPFSYLAQYGITYQSLGSIQKTAIDLRGGPDVATIQVTSQINVPNRLDINGLEFQVVQSLDPLTRLIGITGFGVNANATIIDQSNNGPAVALGVSKYTYNLTGYYESHGIQLRVTQTYRSGTQSSGLNQNGIAEAAIYSDPYRENDFSSIFDLNTIFGTDHLPQLTFDIVNFTNSTLRSYFQYPNATYNEYKPGRQFLIGVRGTF